MKLKDQVCSFEQAKKFVELGIFLDTFWSYDSRDKSIEASHIPYDYEDHLPAPTVAELGVLLPETIYKSDYYDICFEIRKYTNKITNLDMWFFNSCEYNTEAQARAEALIYLLENKYIKTEDLKL